MGCPKFANRSFERHMFQPYCFGPLKVRSSPHTHSGESLRFFTPKPPCPPPFRHSVVPKIFKKSYPKKNFFRQKNQSAVFDLKKKKLLTLLTPNFDPNFFSQYIPPKKFF